MSTATAQPVQVQPVSLPRVLRSEWIKFWSLRSTYWVIAATWLAMVFVSAMMGLAAMSSDATGDVELQAMGLDGLTVISVSYSMAQLAIAVLGVLIISSEYSTGMIRSSLVAAPARWPVLLAKAAVIAVVSFLTGIIGVGLSYVVTMPMLGNIGGPADLSEPETLQAFWGIGLYLMGVALMSLGVGALLRHTAGAIATVLGVLLVLPSIIQLIGLKLDFFATLYRYLPSTAGERITMT